MLRMSKALNASQAQTYHQLEYTSATQSYYKQEGAVAGEWQGKLAAHFGLTGEVTAEQFTRLSQGQHPETGVQLVKHREAQTYTNPNGSTTKAVEHRAGWDATFSPPKSVSITALVGGDDRIRQWHNEAVTAAISAAYEPYAQARIGGNNQAETTGKLLIAKFEHDTARPVDGYAAPQLHTHAVVFNMTERANGRLRALQPQALFDSQQVATATYQSHLVYKMQNEGGYQFVTGKSGAPELKGYSPEYLDASSLRSQKIREALEKAGQQGYNAANIAAKATREAKQVLPRDEVLAAHREVAARFGNQHEQVIAEASKRAKSQKQTPDLLAKAKEAMTYARRSNFEREAVTDERLLLRDALRRGMGETTFAHVKTEFEARRRQGDFQEVKAAKHATGRSFTTPETIAGERANIRHVMTGQRTMGPIMTPKEAATQAASQAFLNQAQRTVIQEVLTSPDRIHGVQGLAGTGKTTVLSTIREGAEASGYKVEGFAPTSRAAGQLREEGIEATTLQSYLSRRSQAKTSSPITPNLYMLDESSLASTKQMRAFLDKIGPEDRVLVIGDTAQHQGVDAGRPFQQMQDAGMRTSQLAEIVRQRKNPELLQAVKLLAGGETANGIKMLGDQGRITEIADPKQRVAAIARDYAAQPEKTIIVSPDNRSRQLINEAVRVELHQAGKLGKKDHALAILVHRSDMTGADREWAARYHAGDILKYETGSKVHGIARNSTATVQSTDARNNTITVQLENGQAVTYDPKRLKGVNVYQEAQKEFATGDRIQITAKNKELGVSNRDLGTVTKIETGWMTVKLEGKEERTLAFDPRKMRHFDHGYAVTSHVSQGLTEDRVLAHIDTTSPRALINSRLSYVALSRGALEARIYTNDATTLGARLATEVSKTSAVDFRRSPQPVSPQPQPPVQSQAQVHEYADPNHRLAAVARAYAERPAGTIVLARDQAERRELNQLIRADQQASGTVAPDSKSLTVRVEKELTNRKDAAQYAPGDVIQYRKGSPSAEGIPDNSTAVVVSIDRKNNQLTVETAAQERVTYSPHLTKGMTAQSKVYREEQQEFAKGDRIHFTESIPTEGIRRGDFARITAMTSAEGFEVRLDRGPAVQLSKEQAQHVEHGYAVGTLKTGAHDRVLLTHDDSGQAVAEATALSRARREVNVYTSEASVQTSVPSPSIAPPEQLKPSLALPVQLAPSLAPSLQGSEQQQVSPSNVITPQQAQAVSHRHGHRR